MTAQIKKQPGDLSQDSFFYRRFFTLTAMIAFQNLIVFGVNLADNVMLGGYHESSLSGVALVNQLQFFLQMVIGGVGEGIVVLCARHWGQKDIPSIRRVVSIGTRIALGASLVLWFAAFFFPNAVLGLFTNEQAVIVEGAKYLQIVCFSYPFFAFTSIALSSLRSVETVRIGFVVSLSTLVINCCLNYAFIYGNFGAPELGVQGAAIATLTSRVVEFCIIAIFLRRFDDKIQMKLRDFGSWDKDLVKSFLRVGTPVILSNSFWGIAMGVQTAILGRLGASAIAANSIATTVFQILSVIGYGAASATCVLVGKTIGEGRMDVLRRRNKTLQLLYLTIGVVTGVLLFFAKDLVVGFYSISPETKALALQFMTVLSVTIAGTCFQVPVFTGIVRGSGEPKFVLINDSAFMWLLVIPLSWLSAFVFGLSPLWVFIFLKCDQVLKCIVAVIKVNFFYRVRSLKS